MTHRETMSPDAMMISTIAGAAEKAHKELGISEADAMQLMNGMMRQYPELGQAHSALEIVRACQDYGD